MQKSRDTPSRTEIHERVSSDTERLVDTGKKLDEHASDIALIRETLERLSMSGTTEGAQEVSNSIETAENDVTERFEEEGEALEDAHEETTEHETELLDRSALMERDLGEISDASAGFRTDVPLDRFTEAKDAALEDIEILKEQADQIRDERDKSEALKASLDALVRKGR